MKGNMKVPRATIVAWAKQIARTGPSSFRDTMSVCESVDRVKVNNRTRKKLDRWRVGITSGDKKTLLSLQRPPLWTFHAHCPLTYVVTPTVQLVARVFFIGLYRHGA
jgi:hypothetical protein